jgi:hypothetical protein
MSEAALDRGLRELLHSQFELRPNRIVFHAADEMRVLHQVGVALKEQKVVDHRPKAVAPPHVDVRPPKLPKTKGDTRAPQEVHS